MTPRLRPRLHSFLAPHIQAYRDFMQKMGYTSFSRTTASFDFDYYLLFHAISSLDQINEGVLFNWIHAIPGHAAATKNKKIQFAKGLFGYLIRINVAHTDPAAGIAYLKVRPFKPHIYTIDELQKILMAAGKYKSRHPGMLVGWTLETLILLVYACGLRLGEALNLKIQDVDFEENILSLWNTKFHKERLVPFSPALARRLKVYLAVRRKRHPPGSPQDPFFCHSRGKFTHSNIETHFRNILIGCGLARPGGRQEPRIHDLRHTFATHRLYKWYQEGHDPLNKLPLLSTYMGHVNITATQVYLHMTQTILREAGRRFQDSFGDVIQTPMKNIFKKL